MNDKFIKKSTFSEICRIMKDNNTDIGECITGVFEVALLFFPGLICKDVEMLINIANGVSLLTAAKEIEKSIKHIYNTFNNKKYEDFTTRYEHAKIAHILIVFAAYFDSIKMYLPNEEKAINLSDKEKFTLTDEGVRKYLQYLTKKVESKASIRAIEVFESDLSMPNTIENISVFLCKLQKFYDILNNEFIAFFEKLSFWEELKEKDKDVFLGVLRLIPVKAVENYQKQYYELSVKFNDFFIWGNIQEHKEIKQSIDVGFEKISKQIVTYYGKFREEKARETLEKYERKYSSFVDESIIDISEMGSVSTEDVVFPSKRNIFVPQSFQALIYKNDMRLEQDAWKHCDERENIGKFISDTLRHPVTGELPLLILGLPGAGKSLLCNMLAAQILFHEYYVIIIKLRDTIADETISQQISQQMKRDFSNACTWDDIADSGITKPILLIFDGYDELLQASGRTHSDYIKKIAEFQKDQKNIYNIFVRCLITSRTILIDKALIKEGTPVIKLSDFNDQRIELWSNIWNQKNNSFFIKNGLSPFEIDKSSKIYELARQPLLLLMLALYDSNKNALKQQKSMNSTQLYNSLILEFISREKNKEYQFRSKEKFEQKKIIEKEVRKISIAALGMYNRKALYIRSTELQSDIEFIEQQEHYREELKDAELKESDKLLGSFLFIHKSKSRDIVEKEEIRNAAYEFLHNTFGEFLAAHYIVCEISTMLEFTKMILNNNMEMKWSVQEQIPISWYVCLAYSPLFSRPVVIKMIYEWSVNYLESRGMNKKEINESMNYIINSEIRDVIKGDKIIVLKQIVEKKGNPFRQDEILKHVAIYSLNIIMLRTIVATDRHNFNFDNEDVWNKLVCLWKYTFSDSDFADYANIFMVEPKKNSCLIMYNYGEKEEFFQQKKISKLFNSYLAIGDELTYSIMGALVGNYRKDTIINVIETKQLNIKARYMWNYILSNINRSRISQYDLIDLLLKFEDYCFAEHDVEYIFSYCLLVDFLLKEKILTYTVTDVKLLLLHLIISVSKLYRYYYPEENYLYKFIMDISLNILEYIKIDIKDIEKIFPYFHQVIVFSDHDTYNYNIRSNLFFLLRFYNIVLKKISCCQQLRNGKMLITRDMLYFADYIDNFIQDQDRMIIKSKFLGEFFELLYNLTILNEERANNRFFKICINILHVCNIDEYYRIPINQKINIIKFLYINYKNNNILIHNNFYLFARILDGITVRRTFTISNEAALYLCYLTEKEDFLNKRELCDDLVWIINISGKNISMVFYKEICKLADMFELTRLKKVLEEND